MKSSFWVLCGVVLFCFGSVRCKRLFSDSDDNFLDKTGGGDKIKTEKEEDSDWQLYKARTVWNDLTNEIDELSRMERSQNKDNLNYPMPMREDGDDDNDDEEIPDTTCEKEWPGCEGTGGTCSVDSDGETIKCDCQAGITYNENTACSVPDTTCEEKRPRCKGTGGTCSVDSDGETIKCDCQAGITYNENTACSVPDTTCEEKRPRCKGTGGTCSVDSDGETIKCDCQAGITYNENTACSVPDTTCEEKRPRCKGTGGTCSVDSDGETIKCDCQAGITYNENTACSVPDTTCEEKRPRCKGTGGTCSVDSDGETIKCDCQAGITYNENTACSVPDTTCEEKRPGCKGTGGTCSVNSDGETIKCDCKAGITYNEDTACSVPDTTCEQKNPRCKITGGTCSVDSDGETIKCDCKAGITYSKETACSVPDTTCEEKNPRCKDTGGTCSVDSDGETIKCDCKAGITYSKETACSVTDTICEEKNPKCKETGGSCSVDSDGVTVKCNCKAGITYSKETACSVPDTTCEEKNPRCKETGGTCSVDSDGETIKCDCKAGITYSKETACSEKKPNCKDTGGTCSVSDDGETIKCDCKTGITYTAETGCNVTVDLCNSKKPKCLNTGGSCSVDISKNDLKCVCKEGMNYTAETGCTDPCDSLKCFNGGTCNKGKCSCAEGYKGKNCEELSEAKCKEELQICSETGGTCTSKDDESVRCKCPKDKEFDDGDGCKDNFCKSVCGDKEGVVCSGDETKKDDIKCSCETEGKAFDKDAKECKDDKCFTECGIAHTVKDGDVQCTNGPFGNVKCGCKESENAFDPKDKECKTDYCKEKCGSAKCEGNKFVESEVQCICTNKDQDFIETEKKCKTNFCRKVCGSGNHIKCEGDGDEYKAKEQKDCSCEDDEYLYIKERKYCQKKCSGDSDCKNGGTCKGKDDNSKLCNCVYGTTGDTCDVITACETGKYEKCKGSRGECAFEEGKPVCNCHDGKKLYDALGYCEDQCKEDKSCEGNNRVCNKDNFCVCQDGYEGEDCSIVSGCKELKKKCDEIKVECVFNKDAPLKATCQCKNDYVYDRDNNKCKNPFCFPSDPCKKPAECSDDEATGIGFCKCPDATYYNYRTTSCENLGDKCLLKKTSCGENEVCRNGKCECKYKKEGDECKPKLCTPNPCFANANCSESDGSCFCADGKYFSNNKRCEKAKCSLTQYKTNCSCPAEMERKEGSSDCVPKKEEVKACDQECGYGLCISKKEKKYCKCFTDIAVDNNGKCVLKSSFCAGLKLQEDKMKCKCEGQFTQAEDGITCRLKTCEDDEVKKDCASKGGVCKMQWKGKGYDCECPKGYLLGDGGKCTDPCSLEKNIEECSKTGKFCYNDYSFKNAGTFKCGCPPAIQGDSCSLKADNAYIIKNIPVLKKPYETKSGINKVLLNVDLVKSMELTFSNALFESGYLYDYRVGDSVLDCSVWINFKREPSKAELNAMKLAPRTFPKLCDDCDDSAVVWPPSLLLSEKGLQEAVPNKLDFCSDEVKDLLCGKGAKCDKNKCTCDEGFKIIEYSFKKIATFETRRCEDIDECALGIDVCSKNKNTICVNTFGSYKCVCKEGFKKKETPNDPETDKSDCYDMCSPSPCIKGKCVLKNKTFDCQCQTGVTGSFCDRADEDYKSAKKGTVVVGAVLGTLLAVIVLGVLFYIIKRRGEE